MFRHFKKSSHRFSDLILAKFNLSIDKFHLFWMKNIHSSIKTKQRALFVTKFTFLEAFNIFLKINHPTISRRKLFKAACYRSSLHFKQFLVRIQSDIWTTETWTHHDFVRRKRKLSFSKFLNWEFYFYVPFFIREFCSSVLFFAGRNENIPCWWFLVQA